ncbi:unconventional prefoldin RPB5 interactor-like [Argonauta hians]
MDTEHVQRLREEQEQAIRISNDQMHKWNKLKSDYEILSRRLVTLPDKTTHEVMVPIGQKAFMPGQLVHTNEILVLLGDNWFTERSAKQASNVVKRRIKSIDTQIEELELQRNLIVNRTGFTEELKVLSEGKDGVVDINEKYEEEKEREWNIQHQKNVKKYRQKLKVEKQECVKKPIVEDDQKYWDRLEELESQENARNELENDQYFQDGIQVSEAGDENLNFNAKHDNYGPAKKCVRWKNEKENISVKEEKEDDDEDEEEQSSDSSDSDDYLVIKFSHSQVKPKVNTLALSPDGNSDPLKSPICSPSDIYKLFPSQPKSILKSPSTSSKSSPVTEHCVSFPNLERSTTPHIEQHTPPVEIQAFSDQVIEKTETDCSSNSKTTQPQPKRISKFKASRQPR